MQRIHALLNPMDLDLFLAHPVAYLKLYLANDNYNLEDIARAIGNLIVIAWAIHIVDWGIGRGAFSGVFGVRPRTFGGLVFGVFLTPFLHAVCLKDGEPDNSHIVGNTVAFATLGLFVALQGLRLFYMVTIGVALSSGLGIWLFGTEGTRHVGASGVIYGYIGFLLVYRLVASNPLALILGAVAFFMYGWAVVGILPSRPGISWEGHLFGFIGGIVMAYIVSYVKLSY